MTWRTCNRFVHGLWAGGSLLCSALRFGLGDQTGGRLYAGLSAMALVTLVLRLMYRR
jgi:hypothetical protein